MSMLPKDESYQNTDSHSTFHHGFIRPNEKPDREANKSDREALLDENQARKLSHMCEVSDPTEYLTMLEEHSAGAPKPTEYLNLMQEIASIGEEELEVLAQAPTLSDETHAKLA